MADRSGGEDNKCEDSIQHLAENERLLQGLVLDPIVDRHGGFYMKHNEALLICLLMASGVRADSLDSRPPANPTLAANVTTAQSSQARLDGRWKGDRAMAKAKIAGLKADVVRDVKGTSAFVREQANLAGTPSRWLIGLAACGLVVAQLRRKHKSLPQRRIAPYY